MDLSIWEYVESRIDDVLGFERRLRETVLYIGTASVPIF